MARENVPVLKLANDDDVIHRPGDAADGLSDILEAPAPFSTRDAIDAISQQIHRRIDGRHGIAQSTRSDIGTYLELERTHAARPLRVRLSTPPSMEKIKR